jgi:hypothetical protein
MKFLGWCVVIASVLAAITNGKATAQGNDMATVKVVVHDTMGSRISGAKITLTSIGPKDKFTASGGETTFNQVPFGLYSLEARLLGFKTRTEQVGIYQPTLLFHVGLELEPRHSYDEAELSGTVKDEFKARSGLWVRLVRLYGSDFVENGMDSFGHFELDGMAYGKYLLILFENDKVLATKPIDVLGGKQAVELQ